MDLPQLDPFKFENDSELTEIGNGGTANVVSPSASASPAAVGAEPQQQFRERLDQEFAVKSAASSDQIVEASQFDLTDAFVATGTTEHTGGVEGAIDLLTNEIAASLRENET